METLWPDTVVEEANLTQNIYLLRKALGKTADGGSFIETLSKRGYKFVPAVRAAATTDDDALIVSKFTKTHVRITREIVEPDEQEVETAAVGLPIPFEIDAPRALPVRTETAAPGKPRVILRRTAFAVAAAVLVPAVIVGFYFWPSNPYQRGGAGPIKSIAVLPFKAIGAGSDEDFLGLGLADNIITRLGKTGKIAVSPTAAVRRYSERGIDPLAAARALRAEAVLTGNVQQRDERIRVTVQLLRAGDGQPLWTDQFDEKAADIFAMQDLISQRLVGALTLRLSGEEQQRLTKHYTDNVEAYQLYLKGRYYWAKRTPEWVRKAIVSFEQAARLDPNYALAYAGLADSYALTASGLVPKERMPKAKAAAERALHIDESLAEAHTSLAFILYKFEWNWLEAENHFRRAVQLNPNYALAHHWFGECLGLMGRFDEGLAELKEAERLDPLSSPSKTTPASSSTAPAVTTKRSSKRARCWNSTRTSATPTPTFCTPTSKRGWTPRPWRQTRKCSGFRASRRRKSKNSRRLSLRRAGKVTGVSDSN